MNTLHDTEKKVLSFLQRVLPICGHDNPLILAAVSGGPDSMVMLSILNQLAPIARFSLAVITVDHKIRPPEESGGDATFVATYCNRLNLPCTVVELPNGAVAALASEGNGIEDAARHLRYEALESEARRLNADFIALGHNRNDNIETIVMRFLQGGGAGGLSGIKQLRQPFIRPLMDLSRLEIMQYATEQSLLYRIDATNNDETYLRNRIRKSLIPFLDSLTPGWQKAVLALADKMQDDETFISDCAAAVPVFVRRDTNNVAQYISFLANEVTALAPAVLLRFFQRLCVLLDIGYRVPYVHFNQLRNATYNRTNCNGCGLFLQYSGRRFFAGKDIVQNYKTGYFISVAPDVTVSTPYFTIRCASGICQKKSIDETIVTKSFFLPSVGDVVVRSCQPDDVLAFSDGKTLSLKSYYSKEHIPVFLRNEIPVITVDGLPVCFVGSLFNFKDGVDVLYTEPNLNGTNNIITITFEYMHKQ